ncbi:MAG: glycosyltransferase [Deltaproteobacteria bacterium]
MEALVSIVIPVYNAGKYIAESIQSCIDQTYSNIEIIVVNDGSGDDSKNEIDKLVKAYNNIILIDLPHMGKVNAINKGMEKAAGNYVAIHAADDICFPYRIQAQVDLIKKNDAALIFGDMEIVDAGLNKLADSFWAQTEIKPYKKVDIESLLQQNYVSGGTILFDGRIKEKIFPIPEKLLFEDWWIAFVACYYGKIVPTSQKLIKYRQHANNDNASYNNKNIKLLVEKQLRLTARTLNYYNEFENFIIKNENDKNKKEKYIKILKFSNSMNNLILEEKLYKRIRMILGNNICRIGVLSFKNIMKFLLYGLLGKKLLYIKYYFEKLKR